MREYAFIDEQACIGCTLCIQACPVDAILGAAKQMHTVLRDECTGCRDCLEPCPVDCIEMRPFENQDWPPELERERARRAEQRRAARTARLERLERERSTRLRHKKAALEKTKAGDDPKKAAIEAAMKRVAAKKAARAAKPRNIENLTPQQQAQIEAANARRRKARDGE
ncbi:MAG TPA: RnfABCDGE type electron transport complex subunit B [Sedimenticola sp.]|nr:RnfABCDGE type electron transport complex subunit B [Sedimenticola sp.]